MFRTRFDAIAGAAAVIALALGARSALGAEPPRPERPGQDPALGVLGPVELFEGERAFFCSPGQPGLVLDLRAVRLGESSADAFVVAPDGIWPRGRTGTFRVTAMNPSYRANALTVTVRELPPVVAPTEPIARRRACVQIFVWDGGRSVQGELLEQLGSAMGPERVRKKYAATWVLAGRQATRENVNRAIAELAERGYTIDVFSSVHGYPIALADGDWTDFKDNPGMRSVRLHCTTSCYGADGAQDFLDAGVRTYVAARETNYVSAFHLARFAAGFQRGRTVQGSTDGAFRSLEGLVRSPILGEALRSIGRALAPYDFSDDPAQLDRVLEGSRPRVFGDASVTIDTELGPRSGNWY